MENSPAWFGGFVKKMTQRFSILPDDLQLLLKDGEELSKFIEAAKSCPDKNAYEYLNQKYISDTNKMYLVLLAADYYRFYNKNIDAILNTELVLGNAGNLDSNIEPEQIDKIEKHEKNENIVPGQPLNNLIPRNEENTLILFENQVII